MKIIGLMPVRNESWVLPFTLAPLSKICDVIVIADQGSDDDTRKICGQYPSVVLIDNDEIGHSNKVRWNLLDTARNFEGNNLLLSVDADEVLSPVLFNRVVRNQLDSMSPGMGFEFMWAQLWKSLDRVRDDNSVWSNSWKTVAFLDDRKLDYKRDNVVINDHTSRVPERASQQPFRVRDVPLVHLQWVYWERAQVKQAWYRCSELIDGAVPNQINEKYAITLDDPSAGLSRVPPSWFEGVRIDGLAASSNRNSPWQLVEILSWFDRYGVEFFEGLQIWHIDSLTEEFRKRTGRKPAARSSRIARALKSRFSRVFGS